MAEISRPDVPPNAPPPLPSPLAIIATLFHAPTQAFKALQTRPRWWLALVLLVASSLAVQMVIVRHMDMAGTVREQLESSTRGRQLSDAQMEHAIEQGQKFAPFGVAVTALASPVVVLLVGAVYLLGLRLAGSEVEFKPVFATTLHAMLPPALVARAATVVAVVWLGWAGLRAVAGALF